MNMQWKEHGSAIRINIFSVSNFLSTDNLKKNMNMQWKEHGSAIRINIFSVSNFLSTENFKKILICNESNMAVQLELTYSP